MGHETPLILYKGNSGAFRRPGDTVIAGVFFHLKSALGQISGCLDTAWTVLGHTLGQTWFDYFEVLGTCLDPGEGLRGESISVFSVQCVWFLNSRRQPMPD